MAIAFQIQQCELCTIKNNDFQNNVHIETIDKIV